MRTAPHIDLEPTEEGSDPVEKLDELVLAGAHAFSSLEDLNVKIV
jgi:hypothetical protein